MLNKNVIKKLVDISNYEIYVNEIYDKGYISKHNYTWIVKCLNSCRIKFSSAFVIIMVIASCGCENKTSINPVFKDLIVKFEKVMNTKVNLNMELKLLEGEAIGKCYYSKPRLIRIDPVFWDETKIEQGDNELQIHIKSLKREIVVFHELFHCHYNKPDHDDSLMNNICPASIMNKYIISTFCYDLYYDDYIQDLKDKLK